MRSGVVVCPSGDMTTPLAFSATQAVERIPYWCGCRFSGGEQQ
jgi:hypothetical protein